MKKKKTTKKETKLNKILTKKNIIYLLIAIADIFLVIYTARRNNINYITLDKENYVYLGSKTNLIFGRNYITIVISLVVYIYYLLLNKIYFKTKLTKKRIIIPIFIIFIINCLIFYLFTNKVY